MIEIHIDSNNLNNKNGNYIRFDGTPVDIVAESVLLVHKLYTSMVESDKENNFSNYAMSKIFKSMMKSDFDIVFSEDPINPSISEKELDNVANKITELRKAADELENLIKKTKEQTKE